MNRTSAAEVSIHAVSPVSAVGSAGAAGAAAAGAAGVGSAAWAKAATLTERQRSTNRTMHFIRVIKEISFANTCNEAQPSERGLLASGSDRGLHRREVQRCTY